MFNRDLLTAFFLASTILGGCGGGEGDDVTVNFTGTTAPSAGTGGGSGGGGGPTRADTTVSFVSFSNNNSAGTLSDGAIIDQDYIFTSDVEWRLEGVVKVGDGDKTLADAAAVQAVKDNGVTLTIEAGTHVRAFSNGTLLVTRGSRLMAEGTSFQPITFSSLDDNFDGTGEWGGVVIQGFAPHYSQGNGGVCHGTGAVCDVRGEGGTAVEGPFGGNEPDDDSGILRYVRIAEGGLQAGPDNEINGLTLQGVGYGTTLEYIQVHNSLDDGIEWFGGTVNARYLVLTGNDDDDIDFDEGYKGNIQYAIVEKAQDRDRPEGSNDPRAIEANSSDAKYVPQTEAVLANVTIIGSAVNNNRDAEAGPQPGTRLRGAVNVQLFNSSVAGFDRGCHRIDDADTDGNGSADVNSIVVFTNVLNDCQGGIYAKGVADTGSSNVQSLTLSYSSALAINEPQARLSSAPAITAVNNGSGFVFDQTDYVGAVEPGTAEEDAWWHGWIIPGPLDR